MIRSVVLVLFVFGIVFPAVAADFEGSSDHPILTRYPGSEIKWHDVQAFVPYAVAEGPVVGFTGIQEWEEIQGRTTRVYYELEGDKTHLEVFLNWYNFS